MSDTSPPPAEDQHHIMEEPDTINIVAPALGEYHPHRNSEEIPAVRNHDLLEFGGHDDHGDREEREEFRDHVNHGGASGGRGHRERGDPEDRTDYDDTPRERGRRERAELITGEDFDRDEHDMRDHSHSNRVEQGLLGPRKRQRIIRESSSDEDIPTPQPMKVKKKPGPKPTRAPPITKNDTVAKKALIREIEGHWGKDFIKTYIPKIHRPLAKRKKGQSRVFNRRPEDNAVKWHPSVLKSVLMVAKKSDDRAQLKKLMGDTVRWRNQHTGNKKPQLVTTDFDVIDDVLENGWGVAQSCNIRYKHLLNNRLEDAPTGNTKEEQEKYAHLFRDDSVESDEEIESDDTDQDINNELTNDYQLQSGYVDDPPTPRYQQTPRSHGRQQQNDGYDRPPGRQQQMPAYGQPPPYHLSKGGYGQQRVNRYGRPMDYYSQSYGQPPMYQHPMDGYGGYAPRYPQDYHQGGPRRVEVSERRSRHSMGNIGNAHPDVNSTLDPRITQRRRHSLESTPDVPLADLRTQDHSSQVAQAPNRAASPQLKESGVKAEPQGDASLIESRVARTGLAVPMDRPEPLQGDGDDEKYLEAQLALEEANARRAQLQLKLISQRRAKRMGGGSPNNPLNLD